MAQSEPSMSTCDRGPGAARRALPPGLGRWLLWGLLAWCCQSAWLSRAHAAEHVLLPRTVGSSEHARMLRIPPPWPAATVADAGLGVSLPAAPVSVPPQPPADWVRPEYDDSAWTPSPPQTPSSAAAAPGTLWLSPGASTSSPAATSSSPAATPRPVPATGSEPSDGGLIFAEDTQPDGGSSRRGITPASPDAGSDGAAARPSTSGASGASSVDGGTQPAPPPACAGTLYLRRRFAVAVDLKGLSLLTLRARYSDGIVAYLNGVEVVRRRLPAAPTDGLSLALERGPVEPESHHIPLAPGLLLPEGNVLAVEVHPRAVERCPRVELEITASDGPRVVRGPYIERMLGGVLDLALETNTPTYLSLRYGKGDTGSSRDRQLADDPRAPPQTSHRVRLTGLRPGTTYHYQLTIASPTGQRSELPLVSLHTPPASGRPLRFVVYGDSRSGHSVHAQVVQSLLAEDPDLILCTGDVVERGTEDSDWDRYFAVAAPLLERIPVFMAAGNHEYALRRQGAQRLFQLWDRLFVPQTPVTSSSSPAPAMLAQLREKSPPLDEASLPRGFYSFDQSGVHFVALDSNQARNIEQQRWLEADLSRATLRRPRAIIVWMHDGPYSMGWHGDNGSLIRDYVPIFEKYRVSIVFSGHDHDFERGRRGQLNYIVTGGGGAELRPLKCGVPGKRRCKHPPLAFYNEHNYVSVEVLPDSLRVCPKRIDGTALEPCQILRR